MSKLLEEHLKTFLDDKLVAEQAEKLIGYTREDGFMDSTREDGLELGYLVVFIHNMASSGKYTMKDFAENVVRAVALAYKLGQRNALSDDIRDFVGNLDLSGLLKGGHNAE